MLRRLKLASFAILLVTLPGCGDDVVKDGADTATAVGDAVTDSTDTGASDGLVDTLATDMGPDTSASDASPDGVADSGPVVPPPVDVSLILHSIALKSDGTVWTRGRNDFGALGDGSPMTIAGHREAVQVPGVSGVVSVAVGAHSSYVVKADGTVWSWGRNADTGTADIGYLGDGTKVDRPTPGPAKITGVAELAVGGAILARKTDGTVWAWGNGLAGALGLGTDNSTPTPLPIPGLSDIVAVASGGDFSFALRKDGALFSWGRNNVGQLGQGLTDVSTNKPGQIPGLSGVVSVCARVDGGSGTGQGFAVKSDGTVWAWGYNYAQELGVDTSPVSRVLSPVQVTGITGAAAVSCGALHTMVRKTDGTVWGWGYDWAVGIGTTADGVVKVPTAVPGLSSVKRVFAQHQNTFAWTMGGLLYAWGDDSFGQLGAGKVAGGRSDHPILVTNAF